MDTLSVRRVAAVAALFVVLAACTAGNEDVENGNGELGTSSATPESDVSADPIANADWSRVAHDEEVFGGPGQQDMFSVTTGGPGLVAVGTAGDGENQVAAVWTSPDGQRWSRVAHDEDVFGGTGQQQMHSVAAGGPGLVAVGRESEEGLGETAAVWTSPDGHTWSRVARDDTVFGDAAMQSVAAGGPGLVAVGEALGQQAAAVWTSPDGHTWSRIAHDETVFGGSGRQQMKSVAAGGPGLVAVGGDFSEQSARVTPAVWTSPSGQVWSRVVPDQGAFRGARGQGMNAVAAGELGLVAVGPDLREGSAAVWTSPDGRKWSQITDHDAVFGGPEGQMMNSVAMGRPGVVGVGADLGQQAAAVWIGQASRSAN